jgi:hypothetical protein
VYKANAGILKGHICNLPACFIRGIIIHKNDFPGNPLKSLGQAMDKFLHITNFIIAGNHDREQGRSRSMILMIVHKLKSP